MAAIILLAQCSRTWAAFAAEAEVLDNNEAKAGRGSDTVRSPHPDGCCGAGMKQFVTNWWKGQKTTNAQREPLLLSSEATDSDGGNGGGSSDVGGSIDGGDTENNLSLPAVEPDAVSQPKDDIRAVDDSSRIHDVSSDDDGSTQPQGGQGGGSIAASGISNDVDGGMTAHIAGPHIVPFGTHSDMASLFSTNNRWREVSKQPKTTRAMQVKLEQTLSTLTDDLHGAKVAPHIIPFASPSDMDSLLSASKQWYDVSKQSATRKAMRKAVLHEMTFGGDPKLAFRYWLREHDKLPDGGRRNILENTQESSETLPKIARQTDAHTSTADGNGWRVIRQRDGGFGYVGEATPGPNHEAATELANYYMHMNRVGGLGDSRPGAGGRPESVEKRDIAEDDYRQFLGLRFLQHAAEVDENRVAMYRLAQVYQNAEAGTRFFYLLPRPPDSDFEREGIQLEIFFLERAKELYEKSAASSSGSNDPLLSQSIDKRLQEVEARLSTVRHWQSHPQDRDDRPFKMTDHLEPNWLGLSRNGYANSFWPFAFHDYDDGRSIPFQERGQELDHRQWPKDWPANWDGFEQHPAVKALINSKIERYHPGAGGAGVTAQERSETEAEKRFVRVYLATLSADVPWARDRLRRAKQNEGAHPDAWAPAWKERGGERESGGEEKKK